jgi:hypothetical protein
LGFLLLALCSSISYACSDAGCAAPRGTILIRGYDSCNSLPFLSPSNDSRLNLELLLIDAGKLTGSLSTAQTPDSGTPQEYIPLRVPFDFNDWQPRDSSSSAAANVSGANTPAASNDYAQGEGSRCRNAGDGMQAFTRAVNAAVDLPKEDVSILTAARGALVVDCNSATHSDWSAPQGIRSEIGREFAAYVAGASAFYAGDFKAALSHFKSLQNSANPWLKDTSSYMIGRTSLNAAQQHAFGEWGDLTIEKVDKDSLKETEDAFQSYLHHFPRGLYAVSAQGLLRRVYWLGGDQARLAEAFDHALADSEKRTSNVTVLDLVQEADSKLLVSVDIDRINAPELLAIMDLMRMRSEIPQNGSSTAQVVLTLADLEKQKDRFQSNPVLYEYLIAAFHMYVDNQPKQALDHLPSLSNVQLSYFAFSQQTLRVLALDNTKQFDDERKLLLQMLPLAKLPLQSDQLQLALARLDVETGHADRIFAPESPIRDNAIRMIVVEHIASAETLRQRIKDPKENRDISTAALYTLLYKELTGRKHQPFQTDLALVPLHPPDLLAPFVAAGDVRNSEYKCPALREVASTLQRDPSDARSLNCVGELFRLQGVHYSQDAVPAKGDLGGSDSMFPGVDYSRMDGYLKVIANKQADGDARAYALFRAVRCYAPSGVNDCGNQNIPKSTRKQWFQMLHQEYPNSMWAKSLKYYW